MDQSVLEFLPLAQRQKVTRQLRQKQVTDYLEFIREERERHGGSIKRERRDNKKGTAVAFRDNFLLQDAVESFDDLEGLHFSV